MANPGILVLFHATLHRMVRSHGPPWVRTELKRMGFDETFEDRTSGPINAIMIDRAHGSFWGGSSNHGEDYGIGW